MSVVPSESASLYQQQLFRSERYQYGWKETLPHNNPTNTQSARMHPDPAVQQIAPFSGRRVDGRQYLNWDHGHLRRHTDLATGEAEQVKMQSVMRLQACKDLVGDGAEASRFWRDRLENWHC
jgi:hypothetical protein